MLSRIVRPLAFSAMLGTVVTVSACSGNLGSGGVGGLPVTPGGTTGYQQPAGPANAASASRERDAEGAVYLTSDMRSLPLPTLDGFALAISLESPAPTTAPSAAPSATAAASLRQKVSRVVTEVAQVAVPSEAAASPLASGSPSPSPSPSPVASAATPKSSPSPSPTPKSGTHTATPNPNASGPKIDTKLVIYPEAAPDAPTPVPSGNVQQFTKRTAIVRGYLSPAIDLPIYGLAAAHFTIPKDEQTAGRGFTIAIFTSVKKHRELIASDPEAKLSDNVVASTLTTPFTLKKGTAYDVLLYGDELAATPAPVPSAYPTPGTNPFVTPMPSGYPGSPNGFQTPYPAQTYAPSNYATPYPTQPPH
jgi:hypothetical protein